MFILPLWVKQRSNKRSIVPPSDTVPTRALPPYGDSLWVSSERVDVPLDPLQSSDLVHEAVVPCGGEQGCDLVVPCGLSAASGPEFNSSQGARARKRLIGIHVCQLGHAIYT